MPISWITGICVQPNRLEWTVLHRVKETWEVADQGDAPTPGAHEADGALSLDDIRPHLKRFHGKIVLALPTERVLLRVELLPSTDSEELRGMADLQTDQLSPFPVETVASGAEVLETSESSSLVALAVVRHEDIDSYGRVFQDAGVPPDVMDVSALGWWWDLKQGDWVPSHGAQILLRSGNGEMELTLIRDGAPLLFRSLVPPPEAGDSSALEEWLQDCSEEILYSLTSLEPDWGGGDPPTLHVFYGAESAEAWCEALKKQLGVDSCFTHSLASIPSRSEGVARRLAAPGGRLRMDLAPEAWREADLARRARRKLLRAATVFAAVWLLALGLFWTGLNLQRGRMSRLRNQVAELEGPAMEVRRLRAKVRDFTLYADRSHSALEELRILSETLPPGMEINNKFIYQKGNSVSLQGVTDVPGHVYDFIKDMQETGHYTEVNSGGITTKGNQSQFRINMTLPGGSEEEGP